MDKIEVTNGTVNSAHYGPIGDAARKIASYCDGTARKHVYQAAFNELSAHTQQSDTPVAWMPIDSAPTNWDDVVVYSPDHAGFNCGGVFLAFYDPDDSIWHAHGPSGNIRLHPTHWQPLPAAPDATNTHPPATDVAALVEALGWYGEQARLCRLIHSEGDAGRHALNEDGGKLARQALAPFTKGQP